MRRFRNIVYVTRGTTNDSDALVQALGLARANTDEILRSRVDKAEREHKAAFEKLVHESGISGPLRAHHPRGRPEQAIVRLAGSLGVDILVMGTVARTGSPGFVIGNTAEDVLGEIRCSLLALKPNGFVSPVRAYG